MDLYHFCPVLIIVRFIKRINDQDGRHVNFRGINTHNSRHIQLLDHFRESDLSVNDTFV